MAGHEAIERHEHGAHAVNLGPLGRRAALLVAMLAAVLAVSEMQGESMIKKAITSETKVAGLHARIETDEVKIAIDHLSGTSAPAIEERALEKDVAKYEHRRDEASAAHTRYEYATVITQVGIVLASVSVIAGAAWLLGLGGLAGLAGLTLLLLTLLGL